MNTGAFRKEAKVKKQKKIKVTKVRSTKLRTAGKVLLWTMLGLIFIKGAADIIMGNRVKLLALVGDGYVQAGSQFQFAFRGTGCR